MVFLSETIDSITETVFEVSDVFTVVQPSLDFINTILGIVLSLGAIGGVIWGVMKKLINPKLSFERYVNRVYTQEKLSEVCKYYIHTRAQDIDPCEQDEIIDNNGKFFTQDLIKFFLEDAFAKSSAGRFYLVLADSGMGKTTFILRLYRQCLRKYSSQKKQNVILLPLTGMKCLEKIQKIENPENTILLLDALDENEDAINNCDVFFTNLVGVTSTFNKVVITCRTQFFPSLKEEPSAISVIQVGRQNKKTEVVKKYLCPFTDSEVKLYLKKRFHFNIKLRKKAYQIVYKVPNIMARPLILNWINFLCDSNEDYQYSFQIYDTIISKWIEREDLGNSKKNLFGLSRAIAEYMFKHKTTTIPSKKVDEIAVKKEVNLEPIIAKSRSLLNRNGRGEYKFAHRSFLEYFIVFGILEKMRMPDNTDFLYSLSGAKRFLLEILISTVSATDPNNLNEVTKELSKYKKYTGVDTVLDFIQNPKLQISHKNNDIGFTVQVWQQFIDLEVLDQVEINKIIEFFRHSDGPMHQALYNERELVVGLVFNVIDGQMPPHTTWEIEVERNSSYKVFQELQ